MGPMFRDFLFSFIDKKKQMKSTEKYKMDTLKTC